MQLSFVVFSVVELREATENQILNSTQLVLCNGSDKAYLIAVFSCRNKLVNEWTALDAAGAVELCLMSVVKPKKTNGWVTWVPSLRISLTCLRTEVEYVVYKNLSAVAQGHQHIATNILLFYHFFEWSRVRDSFPWNLIQRLSFRYQRWPIVAVPLIGCLHVGA